MDRVCVCSDGYYSPMNAGGMFEDCIAWSACEEGLEVSLVGSASRDQVCGLKLVASMHVPVAVSDIEAFKDAVANASGTSGAVVEITDFRQRLEAAASFPGNASDYESPVVQEQFRMGVAAALEVDLAAVSDITVVTGAGRRLLESNVSISFVVTVADISSATAVATSTQSTTTFAQTLVHTVNEAAGATLLHPDQVSVQEPMISTRIQYEVVVETSDTSVISSVQNELGQASVIAEALTVYLGVTVDASALTVDATVACRRPGVQGYEFSESSVLPGNRFNVTASCASGWEGAATAVSCDTGPNAYSVSGCTAILCTSYPAPQGYTDVEEVQLDRSQGFEVSATCDASSGFTGTAAVVPCTTSGAPFSFTGCEPCDASQCAMCVYVTRSVTVCESWGMDCGCYRARSNTCTIPVAAAGVNLTGLSCTSTTSGYVDCPGEPTCASGYRGLAVAECDLLPAGPDLPLSFAGCQPITGQCFGNLGGVGDYSCPAGSSARSRESLPSVACAAENCTTVEQTRRNGECCVFDDCSQCNSCVEAAGSIDICESFGVDCDCYLGLVAQSTYAVAAPPDETSDDEFGGLLLYATGTVLVLAACLLLCGTVRCGISLYAHSHGPRGKSNSVRPEPRPRPAHGLPEVAQRLPNIGTRSHVPKPSPPAEPLPPLKLRGRELRLANARGVLPSIQRNPAGPSPVPPSRARVGGGQPHPPGGDADANLIRSPHPTRPERNVT